MEDYLQMIALNIYNIFLVNDISIEMELITRSQYDKKDFISNLFDANDWGCLIKFWVT